MAVMIPSDRSYTSKVGDAVKNTDEEQVRLKSAEEAELEAAFWRTSKLRAEGRADVGWVKNILEKGIVLAGTRGRSGQGKITELVLQS